MAQSLSIPMEHAHLIFSSNNLRNCTIQCDALGLHYQLSTPMDGMLKKEYTTTITKWDPHEGREVVIAEWQRKQFGTDTIRLNFWTPESSMVQASSLEDGFISMDQFFPRVSGIPGFPRFKRTFTTKDGKRYAWISREFSLKLFEEGSDTPIAEFGDAHQLIVSARNAYISIAPGYEKLSEYIVTTGVIALWTRN